MRIETTFDIGDEVYVVPEDMCGTVQEVLVLRGTDGGHQDKTEWLVRYLSGYGQWQTEDELEAVELATCDECQKKYDGNISSALQNGWQNRDHEDGNAVICGACQ